MHLSNPPAPSELVPDLDRVFRAAQAKMERMASRWDPADGAPVFTVEGRYTARGWTDWTQGFLFGNGILIHEAIGAPTLYEWALSNTRAHMPAHLTHIGVHDHGFHTISTYGHLRRLLREGRIDGGEGLPIECELAIKVSGAVQAMRWTTLEDGSGFVHSFNGPHSLFSDTIRSCRVLVLADALGQKLLAEHDERISLRERALAHVRNTLRYNVWYGTGRDAYDIRGRVAHEGIFNVTDGRYRCPSTQQGYSAFTTWTRGLAWILLGCAELLEFFDSAEEPLVSADRDALLEAALATADFYIDHTTADGIPFWDTGAPGIVGENAVYERVSDPAAGPEPVDSSAAAIVAQGLMRLAKVLGDDDRAGRYRDAGLIVTKTLCNAPYLSEDPEHEGLLLHSVYHRPNDWDHIPAGASHPYGEACMWGDYHVLELAAYAKRIAENAPYLTFF